MMATEAANAPTNGTYGHHAVNPYATNEQNFGSHQVNNAASTGYTSTPSTNATRSDPADISKEEVAWYFVEQYYTTMSRNPEKLYLFFNKRSQFVSGVEEAKVGVCLGQKAILERIKDLDYQDCKVRVTNVDSQSSETNIVIQVIGEMSNKAQPHRKFVQTFILAAQTNGYFVLNDIFRYIKEEDDEVDAETSSAAVGSGYREPSHTAAGPDNSTKQTVSQEDVAIVDKKLEEVANVEPATETEPVAVNGTPEPEKETPVEEEPAAPVAAPEEPEVEEPEIPTVEEAVEPEKPKDPAPTPAPAPKASPKPAATPAAAPKPAVAKTWAQLASASRATAAAAAAAPAQAAPTNASQAKPAQKVATASAAPTAATSTLPVREPSPADSQKEGSTGGWQTAGADHSRKQSRAQVQPAIGQDGKVRAYVKNVYQTVDADALKALLSKFGEIAYFDVSRAKNSAFVEFATVAGFQAAVAANPHKIGDDAMFVEERRVAGQFNPRGGSVRGGRGGFEQRPGGQGRGGFGKDTPRGGFTGARSGRGGPGGAVTPRGGGRGAAQAA